MSKLLDRVPGLEAVFVSNDSMALGALQAVAGFGRSVPEDLAVVGFDNIPESVYFSPALTTVKQGLRDIGGQAVRFLDHQLKTARNEEALTAQVAIVEPQLIVRQSPMRKDANF